MSSPAPQKPEFVERRQASGAEQRKAIDQSRMERMNNAGELGIHTSYLDQIFTRQIRDNPSGDDRPETIVLLEAALRGFLPEHKAIDLLNRPGANQRAPREASNEARDPLLKLDPIEDFIARGRDECRRDSLLAAPIAEALTNICSDHHFAALQDQSAFLKYFDEFEKLIVSEQFIQSKPDSRQSTPLTDAVLEFQAENWNPSGMMFWDDPLTKFLFAVSKCATQFDSAAQEIVMNELQKERESLLARGLQERVWDKPDLVSSETSKLLMAQRNPETAILSGAPETSPRLSDKIKQRRLEPLVSKTHASQASHDTKKTLP